MDQLQHKEVKSIFTVQSQRVASGLPPTAKPVKERKTMNADLDDFDHVMDDEYQVGKVSKAQSNRVSAAKPPTAGKPPKVAVKDPRKNQAAEL